MKKGRRTWKVDKELEREQREENGESRSSER